MLLPKKRIRCHHFGEHNNMYIIYNRFYNTTSKYINPLNPDLNSICYLLALLGAHHFLHVRRMRVKDTGRSRVMNTQQTIPVVVQPAAWFYGLSFFWDCGFESRAAEWMCIFCECCVVR